MSSFLKYMEDDKEALRNEEHMVDNLYLEYYKVMKEQRDVLLELVEEHKLKSQKIVAHRRMQRLVQQVATAEEGLRCLHGSILKETYTKETLPALEMIRMATQLQISALQDAHSQAVARIHEYNCEPTDFKRLAQDYGEILAKIENQEVLNEELKRDLSVSPLSGMDRSLSRQW